MYINVLICWLGIEGLQLRRRLGKGKRRCCQLEESLEMKSPRLYLRNKNPWLLPCRSTTKLSNSINVNVVRGSEMVVAR
jgi:hypothetical protein